jgi:hypothetical protein
MGRLVFWGLKDGYHAQGSAPKDLPMNVLRRKNDSCRTNAGTKKVFKKDSREKHRECYNRL